MGVKAFSLQDWPSLLPEGLPESGPVPLSPVSVRCVSRSQGSPQKLPGYPPSAYGTSPGRWVSEAYHVQDTFVKDIIHRFGVLPRVDAFANRYNRRFASRWGPGSTEACDAFDQHWGNGLMWMNPPYTELPRVMKKIQQDHAHVVLVLPAWRRRKWYKVAATLAVESTTYPPGTRFFALGNKACCGCRWAVTAFLVCAHPERCSLEALQAQHTPLGVM